MFGAAGEGNWGGVGRKDGLYLVNRKILKLPRVLVDKPGIDPFFSLGFLSLGFLSLEG